MARIVDEQNVNYSTESFLNKINSLLSNYPPLKKINQQVQIKVSVKTMDITKINISQK